MFVKSVSPDRTVLYHDVTIEPGNCSITKCEYENECKATFLNNIRIVETVPAAILAENIYNILEASNVAPKHPDLIIQNIFGVSRCDVTPVLLELLKVCKQKTKETLQ